MEGRVKTEKIILYISITLIFLVHWIYNDLSSNQHNFAASLLRNLWQVIFVVGINIVYFDYALPYITSRKSNRLIKIIFSVVIHLTVFIAGLYVWRKLGMMMNLYVPFEKRSGMDELYAAAGFAPGGFILFAVLKLFFDYTQLKYEAQQVRLEKNQAELVFLRSQINPHFLFNTLNNIYSLSQYQPKLVSESILRLSKILRYILYESGNELITVDKEIKIIDDYIDLEKLRYSDAVTIEFKHTIENPSEMLPPLLLVPLVENAFKHGVSESRGKRFVEVTFTLQNRLLYFMVRNTCNASLENEPIKENIGLSNLRRRLNLLYKDFDLFTGQKENVFTVILKINLSSYV